MHVRSALVILLLSTAFWPMGCVRAHPMAAASQAAPSSPTSATAGPVDADPLVGAVFLGAADLHTCTGSVLNSSTKNLILTAAHCLSSTLPATFAPGFTEQIGAAARWTVDTIYLDPRWVARQDPLADFAIARVSRPDGRSVESVVGKGLTLGAAPAAGTIVAVTGYPLSVGGAPIGCRVGTAAAPGGFPSLHCVGLVDGTSGAPWRTDTAVVGLIGGFDGGGCDEKVSYSPPFDGHVHDLLHRAEAGGPGDTAPEVFENGC
jgi:Trypsin